MIRKILVRDYLKGYNDMTAEEREAFVGRVGEWLASDGTRLLAITDRPMAKSQNLITISTRWAKEDVAAMDRGISLLSAMVAVAETWLPSQIYMKSAYRAVRQVVGVLMESAKGQVNGLNLLVNPATGAPMPMTNNAATGQRGKATGQALPSSVGATASPGSKRQGGEGITAKQTKKEYQPIPAVAPIRNLSAISHQPSSGMVPARPKHIDQYVHLLPKATQERAAEYGELMRQLGEARDNMQLLMDDDHASAKSREQWAKQATKIDKKIRAIRDELDREWEKVAESGRVVIDDLGMAHLVSTPQCNVAQNEDGASADGEGGEQEPVELTSEQKKRRRDLRKWLIDLRRGKEGKDREKRIEQWRVNWQEYLTLEPREKALEDEKILEAAKHFGIDIGENTAEHGKDADGVKKE